MTRAMAAGSEAPRIRFTKEAMQKFNQPENEWIRTALATTGKAVGVAMTDEFRAGSNERRLPVCVDSGAVYDAISRESLKQLEGVEVEQLEHAIVMRGATGTNSITHGAVIPFYGPGDIQFTTVALVIEGDGPGLYLMGWNTQREMRMKLDAGKDTITVPDSRGRDVSLRCTRRNRQQ